ncbi:MAG: flagellar basal-body rod protein FlgF [Alphaproteobacteria bacterium]|nr:flagellar basal-body rod protein FlgF [Alphaproteobacteria bacterium]
MDTTSLVLLSNQMALLRSVDVISNNIANSSTTGFKREGIQFETWMSRPTSKQSTSFVFDKATYRDMTPGTISTTGNPLDLAIQGKGYFQIQTPTGVQYTRDGAFRTDDQGQIVTSSGMPVLSDGGQPLVLPAIATDVTIAGDGFITAQVGTSPTRAQLGKIGVVQFDNDEAVTPTNNGLLTTTQAPQPVVGSNVLVQGAVEESNVKPVLEITDLIRMQRAYEQASNLIGQKNTQMSDAIDKLSSVSS